MSSIYLNLSIGCGLLLAIGLFFILQPLWHAKDLSKKQLYFSMIVLSLAMISGSYVFYQKVGGEKQLLAWQQGVEQQQRLQKELAKFKNPDQLIEKFKQHLQQQPDSGKGWYLLGRLYITSNRIDEATAAFAKAYQLQPENMDALWQYAQTLYFKEQQNITPQIKSLINTVLQQQPGHPGAINLLAVAAYKNQSYQEAISYWQQLLARLEGNGAEIENEPSATDTIAAIHTGIDNAQNKLLEAGNNKVRTRLTGDAGGNQEGPKLIVSVSMSTATKKRFAEDSCIFVFAKAEQGPPMPLAVVRKQLKDLPLEITLDDNLAMSPQFKLSQFTQVRISARVSTECVIKFKADDYVVTSPIIDVAQQQKLPIKLML